MKEPRCGHLAAKLSCICSKPIASFPHSEENRDEISRKRSQRTQRGDKILLTRRHRARLAHQFRLLQVSDKEICPIPECSLSAEEHPSLHVQYLCVLCVLSRLVRTRHLFPQFPLGISCG